MKALVHKLMHGDLFGIDQRQFEQFKEDEGMLDEWTKQLVESVFVDQMDSPVIRQVKELLKLADKELYRSVRDKKITLR